MNQLHADRGSIEYGDSKKKSVKDKVMTLALIKEQKRLARETLLKAFLEALGTPDDLFKVDIKELHDANHFRINVYRTIKDKQIMTDSFYVTTKNNIVTSNPQLKKKYYDADLQAMYKP